jgi:hypothetical protein
LSIKDDLSRRQKFWFFTVTRNSTVVFNADAIPTAFSAFGNIFREDHLRKESGLMFIALPPIPLWYFQLGF